MKLKMQWSNRNLNKKGRLKKPDTFYLMFCWADYTYYLKLPNLDVLFAVFDTLI